MREARGGAESLTLPLGAKFLSPPTCHQVPLPEEVQVSPGDTEIHRVEPEDVANHLTAFHWELFRCVHEVRQRLVLGRNVLPGVCFRDRRS